MALNFLKKVFSFGRPEDSVEPGPEAPPTPAPAPEIPPAPEPAPAEPTPPPVEIPPEPEPQREPGPEPVPLEIPVPPVEVPGRPAPLEVPPLPQFPIGEPPIETPPAGAPFSPTMSVWPAGVAQPLDTDRPEPGPAGARVAVGRDIRRLDEAPTTISPGERQRGSWMQRLREGLSRSSRELGDNLSGVFAKGRLTEEIVEDLEEALIRADLGMETATRITEILSSGRYGFQTTEADIRRVMAEEVEKVLAPVARPLELDLSYRPHVVLVVGVNGTGKTTTIGKLAAKLTAGGLKVMLAAGDTFRAAAIEQLKIWGERTGAPVVASRIGADAASLAYEAYEKARDAKSDVLIIDTAGRLQNKAELMAELEKIVRVLSRHDPSAPHTVLQTVDATTGQNALNQVEIFRNVAKVDGLVMTKLDGSARGGILVAIAAKHRLPVYFIGVGEQVEDLEPFSARDFARTIAGVA